MGLHRRPASNASRTPPASDDLEATTASPERTSQLKANADQVLAVLTDEQKALWNADASGKLKFQFRDMNGMVSWIGSLARNR